MPDDRNILARINGKGDVLEHFNVFIIAILFWMAEQICTVWEHLFIV